MTDGGTADPTPARAIHTGGQPCNDQTFIHGYGWTTYSAVQGFLNDCHNAFKTDAATAAAE